VRSFFGGALIVCARCGLDWQVKEPPQAGGGAEL
jgi:hypothetical protein